MTIFEKASEGISAQQNVMLSRLDIYRAAYLIMPRMTATPNSTPR